MTAGGNGFDSKSRRILAPRATGGGLPLAAALANGVARVVLCDWPCINTNMLAHTGTHRHTHGHTHRQHRHTQAHGRVAVVSP